MAVWSASRSKDSRVALQFFVLAAMFLVTPCLSAQQRPAPWWTNSCSNTPTYNMCSSSSNSSPTSFRHGRSTTEVKIQLDIFFSTLEFNKEKIEEFYREITHGTKLPRVIIKNLNLDNVIRQMRLKKRSRLLKFYVGLQRVAKLLEQAVAVKVNSTLANYDIKPRYCSLTEVLWALRSLLCEVYEAIVQEVPNATNALNVHTVKGRGKRLRAMGMTDVFIRDISLLRKLKWFVKKSKHILSPNHLKKLKHAETV